MSWQLTGDVEEFADAAGDFLRSRPVEHTVPLTLVDTLRRQGPHAYGPDDPVFGLVPGTGRDGGRRMPADAAVSAAGHRRAGPCPGWPSCWPAGRCPAVNALAGDVDELRRRLAAADRRDARARAGGRGCTAWTR